MTSLSPKDEDDDEDMIAAEYVLGALDLGERAKAEARLKIDTKFADRVMGWENRLSGLNEDFDLAQLPDLMPKIESRLFPKAPKRNWFTDLRLWGGAAAAALAVVGYLALTPPKAEMTATLVADANGVQFGAVITQGRLTITRIKGDVPDAAHSHQLWIIFGTNPPVSLGVIPANGETIPLLGAAAGAVLAVTLEQAGGSPNGQPQGPIIAAGTLAKV